MLDADVMVEIEKGSPQALAWLASLANQLGISLDAAADRYAHGCPKCSGTPCQC